MHSSCLDLRCLEALAEGKTGNMLMIDSATMTSYLLHHIYCNDAIELSSLSAGEPGRRHQGGHTELPKVPVMSRWHELSKLQDKFWDGKSAYVASSHLH